ncbi:lipid A deacylase LpxR family protein [Olivibacter sitiensis]|uniref:lipid A-modifier LpxR family protein n=1 Tax=Olivibacter sitiensis TaxID=376470 RepID=UPI000486080B|nr:lipid A deacylase LpxR family protein [Olivibacter sitiensis]
MLGLPSDRAFAQQAFKNQLSLQNENDVYLFTGQDRYYTNGIHFQYSRAVDHPHDADSSGHRRIWSLGLGQKLFNAVGGNVHFIQEVDRPITGYLYLQGKMQWIYRKRSEGVFSLGAELATIGSTALGGPIQKAFHSLFNLYTISGWEFQLHSAWGVDMRLAHMQLLHRSPNKRFDVSAHSAASIGSNNIYVKIGPQFRLGKFNPLHSSVSTWSNIGNGGEIAQKEFFVFYKPSLTWVGYDATIQGGMFLQDKGPVVYPIKPWLLSHQLGLHHRKGRIGLKVYYVFNSKQSENMLTRHQYGAVQLSYFY